MSEIKNDETNTLREMLKADEANTEEQNLLLKAEKEKKEEDEGEEEEEGKEDYDEKYMNRHMKKYMKKNGKKIKAGYAEEMGIMKKAEEVDDQFGNIEEEIETVSAAVVDGTDFFKAFADYSKEMAKAISGLDEKVNMLVGGITQTHDMSKAVGSCAVELSDNFTKYINHPMIKSTPFSSAGVEFGEEEKDTMLGGLKGKSMKEIKDMTFKAFADSQGKDIVMQKAVSELEVCGGNVLGITPESLSAIKQLAEKK